MPVLYGVSGAGAAPAQASAPSPTSESRMLPRIARGPRNSARTPRAISRGTVARSISASARSCDREGMGRGSQRLPAAGGVSGCGFVSKRIVKMSTPEMPSTSAWCVFDRIAKRPPSMPSTSHISHSGLSRSSCCENTRPASARSCSSEPGAGSAVARMW